MNPNGKPFVYLCGAGPGDPEYVTLRTQKLLQTCDAVLYDALVSPVLLTWCRPDCRKIYTGKRAGHPSMKQTDISALLVRTAEEGKTVVRLKGGDPFVFGRGGEECIALQKAGIPFEVVPGVTSAFSVPMAAGIPVTHRGTSNLVTVITGHSADGSLEQNVPFEALARQGGTLVFLMGLHALPKIASLLLEHGMDPAAPAAVISRGTQPDQHTVRARLDSIADAVSGDPQIVPPAVLVFGPAAGLRLQPSVPRPLDGRKIAVCGTDAFCRRMAERLRREGASLSMLPLLQIVPMEDRAFTQALDHLDDYTGIVFTGRNAVRFFFDAFYRRDPDLRTLASKQFAVIGTSTAAYLSRTQHLHADLCPSEFTSAALADLLIAEGRKDANWLIPRAAKGNPVLGDRLCQAGVSFTQAPIYDTRTDLNAAVQVPLQMAEGPDYVIFASSQGVHAFVQAGGTFPERTLPVCIGPYTEQALREKHYDGPLLLAEKATSEGIADIIVRKELQL